MWAGDDAAVLARPGGSLLVTTDMIIEGVDFELSYASGADVGFKALSAGVSDIAAMGGSATRTVVSVGIDPGAPLSLADALAEGMADACTTYGMAVAGGDLSAAAELSITCTVLGEAPATGAVLRSGAKPGDIVCVTGSLGASAAGLFVLGRGLVDPALSVATERKEAFERLAVRHLRPTARMRAGAALAGLATAMIDLSDGLAVDLGHLTEASRTGCWIDTEALPLDGDLEAVAATVSDGSFDPLHAAITGGEDYELLFTIPAAAVQQATELVGDVGITVIGEMTDPGERNIGERTLESLREQGWEHLR